jgi:hypothetical protein
MVPFEILLLVDVEYLELSRKPSLNLWNWNLRTKNLIFRRIFAKKNQNYEEIELSPVLFWKSQRATSPGEPNHKSQITGVSKEKSIYSRFKDVKKHSK